LDRNENEREPRSADAFKFSEEKYDTPLVLTQHAYRDEEVDESRGDQNESPRHVDKLSHWAMVVERLRDAGRKRFHYFCRGHVTGTREHLSAGLLDHLHRIPHELRCWRHLRHSKQPAGSSNSGRSEGKLSAPSPPRFRLAGASRKAIPDKRLW